MYRILCIGNQWRGADDGSLFKAFSRRGHLISIVDDKMFIPDEVTSFLSKVVKKSGRRFFIKDFNMNIIQLLELFNPDLVIVYKGASVYPETLMAVKQKGIPVICIYPDVSLFDHGSLIPRSIPFYDHIFTTKSFGLADLKNKFGYTNATLIQHCVDPDIHRKLTINDVPGELLCEASFIGTYSPKKDRIMSDLIKTCPSNEIKIWGNGWHRSSSVQTAGAWQQKVILGDLYALAIVGSSINIAILSEQRTGASSGDLITARTFHIPGAGGFMLHERTEEFAELFREGIEADAFSDSFELKDKVGYYLTHEEQRRKIALAGHQLVMEKHTSDHRSSQIIDKLINLKLLKAKS